MSSPHKALCQQLLYWEWHCLVRVKRQFEPSQVVIFLPATLVQDVLTKAHGNLLVGHNGIYKTKERLLLAWYGCWHCPPHQNLPQLPNETKRWSASPSIAVIFAATNRTKSTCPRWSVWTCKTSKSGKSIFCSCGRSHKICQIGAPAK